MSKQQKKIEEQNRRLTFFDQEEDHYAEKKIGVEWRIKSYNGGTGRWQVSIYSERSYKNYKSYGEHQRDFENAINKED